MARVAYNLVVDALRREQRLAPLPAEHTGATDVPTPAMDDELALTFLCCHAVLPRAAQVALTLKIACGFTGQQIARAFLSRETTINQRIVRAKQRLRQMGARFEVPDSAELSERLEPVLDVLYLTFKVTRLACVPRSRTMPLMARPAIVPPTVHSKPNAIIPINNAHPDASRG